MSESTSVENASADIVAYAGRYYRNARYLITLMALGAGLWFAYDGFYNWPKQVGDFSKLSPAQQALVHVPPNETSIALNKLLGVILIPLAPIFFAYFMHRSRGEYRLSGDTLHVPGHPPIPLDAVESIDKTLWDRKGIAVLEYRSGNSERTARVTLDDFIYDQKPTDRIVEQIEAHLTPPADAQPQADPA
jgi:hypothetical protein